MLKVLTPKTSEGEVWSPFVPSGQAAPTDGDSGYSFHIWNSAGLSRSGLGKPWSPGGHQPQDGGIVSDVRTKQEV